MNSMNNCNIKITRMSEDTMNRMSDEDGNTEEDEPEVLAVEKSSSAAGVERKERNWKRVCLIENDWRLVNIKYF